MPTVTSHESQKWTEPELFLKIFLGSSPPPAPWESISIRSDPIHLSLYTQSPVVGPVYHPAETPRSTIKKQADKQEGYTAI